MSSKMASFLMAAGSQGLGSTSVLTLDTGHWEAEQEEPAP